jgi:hypothetical protein
MHVTINCFAAGAATDQIMYFIILPGDMELRLKKIGRNSEGVWTKQQTAQVTHWHKYTVITTIV